MNNHDKEEPRFFSRLPEEFGGKIPFIVTDLIDQLRLMNASDIQGLFRLNGGAREMTELAQELDKGRIADWSKYKNPHAIACVLKKYFKEKMPNDPLFPYSIYNDLLTIPQLPDLYSQAAKFKDILQTLSKPRQLTIIYLFQYILEVESKKDINKMNASNLAIVFAPNILASQDTDPTQLIIHNTMQNKFLTTLINIGHDIFDGVDLESSKIVDEDIPIILVQPISKEEIETFVKLRKLRRRSLIPYIAQDMFYDTKFIRPTRNVVFTDD